MAKSLDNIVAQKTKSRIENRRRINKEEGRGF